MLEALTFDFWGTLYHGAWGREERLALLEQALDEHGVTRSPAQLEDAYDHARRLLDRAWREERRSVPTMQWLDELLRFLEVDLPPQRRRSLCRPLEEVYLTGGAPRPVPGVSAVLPRLARDYRLGVISDVGLTPGRVLREVMRHDGLLPHFDVLTFSDVAGVTKPEPAVFLDTLAALQAEPRAAAHIGDLPETDLRGAKDVGMHAVLFLGVSHREDGIPLADASFETYAELGALLTALDQQR